MSWLIRRAICKVFGHRFGYQDFGPPEYVVTFLKCDRCGYHTVHTTVSIPLREIGL